MSVNMGPLPPPAALSCRKYEAHEMGGPMTMPYVWHEMQTNWRMA